MAAAGLDTCGHVHQMWRLVSAAPGDRGYGGTSALLLAAAGHLAHYKHRHHDQDRDMRQRSRHVVAGVGVLGISERSTNLRCDLEMINNQILQKMSNIQGVCRQSVKANQQ